MSRNRTSHYAISPARRRVLRALATAGVFAAAGAAGCAGMAPGRTAKARKAKVVVVGGGPGGATCAKYLRRFAPEVEVTLVEPARRFVTCFGSNWVLGGLRGMAAITHGYDGLRRRGVRVVHDRVTAIDPEARRVRLAGGASLPYDRLVVSPGIDFRWDAIDGAGPEAAELVPHAWKAGPQTVLLRRQIEAMPDGGTVLICPPGNPFRCPPGPYERASLVAHYLKRHKPRAKVLILDAKDKFSKQPLFMDAWKALYGDMIEWIPGSGGGLVHRVDPRTRTVYTEGGLGRHRGDVVNLIPPQKAGALAHAAGLTDGSGWCPVRHDTFESRRIPGVHVIGDASIASPMPKSGHAANTQAKMTAAAIALLLREQTLPAASWVNTCYSLVGPDYGISVAAVYTLADGRIVKVKGAGGVSPRRAGPGFRRQEAVYARGWYENITRDIFA